MRTSLPSAAFLSLCLLSTAAFAEGTNETTQIQALRPSTTILVDILDNATETFTYTILIASVLDGTLVDFSAINNTEYGTNKTDIDSPMVVTNTGNKQLALRITGDDLSDIAGTAPNISVSQFYVNNVSNASGALRLNNLQQIIPGTIVPVEDATPGGNTEDVFWIFSVPDLLQTGNYSGTWILVEE